MGQLTRSAAISGRHEDLRIAGRQFARAIEFIACGLIDQGGRRPLGARGLSGMPMSTCGSGVGMNMVKAIQRPSGDQLRFPAPPGSWARVALRPLSTQTFSEGFRRSRWR